MLNWYYAQKKWGKKICCLFSLLGDRTFRTHLWLVERKSQLFSVVRWVLFMGKEGKLLNLKKNHFLWNRWEFPFFSTGKKGFHRTPWYHWSYHRITSRKSCGPALNQWIDLDAKRNAKLPNCPNANRFPARVLESSHPNHHCRVFNLSPVKGSQGF